MFYNLGAWLKTMFNSRRGHIAYQIEGNKEQSNIQAKLHALAVILLPAHPASFAHNFVSRMQIFYFSESQDAIVLQTCH